MNSIANGGASFNLAFSSTIWGLWLQVKAIMGNFLPVRFSRQLRFVEILCREFIGLSPKELFRVEKGHGCLVTPV